MVEQKGRKKSDLAELDQGIASLIESRTGKKPSQRTIKGVRRGIIDWLAEGLGSGDTLAVIKRIDEETVKIIEFPLTREQSVFERSFEENSPLRQRPYPKIKRE